MDDQGIVVLFTEGATNFHSIRHLQEKYAFKNYRCTKSKPFKTNWGPRAKSQNKLFIIHNYMQPRGVIHLWTLFISPNWFKFAVTVTNVSQPYNFVPVNQMPICVSLKAAQPKAQCNHCQFTTWVSINNRHRKWNTYIKKRYTFLVSVGRDIGLFKDRPYRVYFFRTVVSEVSPVCQYLSETTINWISSLLFPSAS